MRIKIKFNAVPIDMIESVRMELSDLGYNLISLDRDPQIVVEKDAENIKIYSEMYGFNQMFGVANIEYLN